MSNVYSAPSISGYNDTPPSDDGANTASNEVTWSGIKTKLGDPVKTYAQSISSAVSTAFGKIFFNAVSAESSDYTVVAGDRGKLLSCTNTITITLLAAATAGDGFVIGIKNSGSGVITVDGYSSETINGNATIILNPGDMIVIVCDGSNWIGSLISNNIASTYTPTAALITNMDSVTNIYARYSRIGNIVTISGQFTANATTGGFQAQFTLTLPISSTFSNSYEANGTFSVGSSAVLAGSIDAYTTTDTLRFSYYPDVGTGLNGYFIAQYEII